MNTALIFTLSILAVAGLIVWDYYSYTDPVRRANRRRKEARGVPTTEDLKNSNE